MRRRHILASELKLANRLVSGYWRLALLFLELWLSSCSSVAGTRLPHRTEGVDPEQSLRQTLRLLVIEEVHGSPAAFSIEHYLRRSRLIAPGAHPSTHVGGKGGLVLAALQHLRLHHVLNGATVLLLSLAIASASGIDKHAIAIACQALQSTALFAAGGQAGDLGRLGAARRPSLARCGELGMRRMRLHGRSMAAAGLFPTGLRGVDALRPAGSRRHTLILLLHLGEHGGEDGLRLVRLLAASTAGEAAHAMVPSRG